MCRLSMLFLSAVVSVVSFHSPAAAGGWWSGIDLNGGYLGIGENLKFRSEVMFETLDAAERGRRTEYFAYVVRGVDEKALEDAMSVAEPGRWWVPPNEMILVGRVELSDWDANLVIATAHLSIPKMATGNYDLMLCDMGCRTPLANLIPAPVEVTAEPLAARLSRRLEATNERLDTVRARLRARLGRSLTIADRADLVSAESSNAVARLQKAVANLDSDSPSPTPALAFAGWFVAGAAVAFAVTRRRRSSRDADLLVPLEAIPDDARELIESP